MEPLTHFLTGACMARAGLNRKSALATATLVLAAEAPDIDAVTGFGGRIFGFAHHRGITHTFVGAPFVAALVVGVLYVGYRVNQRWGKARLMAQSPPRWGLLWLFGCLAALSHILLDYTNNYGVRPFDPFADKWHSWDIVFIVEPVLWLILIGGLVLPLIFGLVDREIGARAKRPRGRIGAIVALVLVVVFWGVRDYEHRRAIAAMEALTYRNEDAIRVSAYPYMVNPFKWYGVVETSDFFETMDVNSLTPEVDPQGEARVIFKPEETPVTIAAKKSYLGRVYLDWAQYPMTEIEQLDPPDSGYLVRLYDLRYAYPGRARGALGGWVRLDAKLNVVGEGFGISGSPQR
jgi:inner membrane protein